MSTFTHRSRRRQPKRPVARRTFLFVSAAEPLAAAEAVWSAPSPVDLCVAAPSAAARETVTFACAGLPVRVVEEPLLGTPPPGERATELAARKADALLALYALDTRSALVVWDELKESGPILVDEAWLLRASEQIDEGLPFP